MRKLKVLTLVGTRPEIIRLSRIISLFDEYFEHFLVHTGQNFDHELNQIFFEDLEIRPPDIFMECAADTPSKTIGNILSRFEDILDEINPDAFLVLGDTNSCLAAISAKKKKIPIFHMEAGNRCYDMRVPEEVNRKIVDHISDINLTYSTLARDALIREGLEPDMIIKTGSPMKEVLNFYSQKILSSNVLSKLNLEKHQYFLVSLHREENVEIAEQFSKITNILNMLSEHYQIPIIVSTHPRTRQVLDRSNQNFNENIIFLKPLSFSDYNCLQINSKVVLSDSGTISEESSILNFPALNLRESQERHEALEEGSVMLVGLNLERIFQGLTILEKQPRGRSRDLNEVRDYDVDNVSQKVLRIIVSFTDFVKRKVWKVY